MSGAHKRRSTHLLLAVRYVIPSLVVAAGVAVMALGSEVDLEGGAGILSAGLAIFFINWLFRAAISGDRQRDAEAAAREHYRRFGRWPR